MQNTHLFVAAVAARVGDSVNPGLRSETWGTRIWGGVEGCTISTVAVRV